MFCFFLIPASIVEAAAVIPNGAKISFAKELLLPLMDLLIYSTMTLKTLHIELLELENCSTVSFNCSRI